jgi:tRNA(His) 5'-end guanylyltransferase
MAEIKSIGEYQRTMERFETTNDGLLLPDIYAIVRLDAHRIGSGWKGEDYPFGKVTTQALRECAREMMTAGFRVSYSFTHGDEISLLLDSLETSNQRKRSRVLTLLASHATAAFNRNSKAQVVFHGKMSELPTRSHVVDYFIWQRKVAARNYLTRNIIARLEQQGLEAREIDQRVSKLSEDDRRRLLVEELGFPEEELRVSDLYGYGIWWSDDRQALMASESLGVSDESYSHLLEQVAFRPTPAVDEGTRVPLKKYSSESETAAVKLEGRAAPLPPIERKKPLRFR